jgi:hypothetical protein
MGTLLRRWRTFYGENPLHLLAMIGCFALVGYVVSFVYPGPSALPLALWFVGAVIAHDLVLYPLYALADQSLTVSRRGRRRILPNRPVRVPAINHVRVPVMGSAVLGIIYFPTIAQRGEDAFRFTAGLGTAAIYGNWLLVTAVLFLGSAVIYAARLGASVARDRRYPAPATAERSPEAPAIEPPASTEPGPAAGAASEPAEPEPATEAEPTAEPEPAAEAGTDPAPVAEQPEAKSVRPTT